VHDRLASEPGKANRVKGKRVQFDDETWLALDTLARDSRRNFQALADEAFADLLRKHGRPASLSDALRESVRRTAANDMSEGAAAAPRKGAAKTIREARKGKRPRRR
jgi:predicted transcriptional regulator